MMAVRSVLLQANIKLQAQGYELFSLYYDHYACVGAGCVRDIGSVCHEAHLDSLLLCS